MPSKLVRDRIPERIRAKGEAAITRIAEPDEYRRRLAEKLCEEAAEFAASEDPEELADVLEVLDALLVCHGFRLEALRELQRAKAAERGGFAGRVILEME